MNSNKYCTVKTLESNGRITIPSEIRDAMQLHISDALELILSDNKLMIQKYEPLRSLSHLCVDYLEAYYAATKVVCAVCTNTKIVCSRGVHLSTEQTLTKPVKQLIANLKPYSFDVSNMIYIHDDMRYCIDSLYPIGNPNKPLGAVILIHFRNTSETEQSCARLIADILTKITEVE